MNKIRTIFIGTPDFGLPALNKLYENENFHIVAVVSQPDKKVGRKQAIACSPIKTRALELNIPVFQPEKITDFKNEILALLPDIAIVIAYAQIIPEDILSIPGLGFINVHGSLLPKYRGAACIQASILNGDKETGVTIMQMDKGLDTGPILKQTTIPIEQNDTTETLYDKLSYLGAEILIPTILAFSANKIKPQNQESKNSSYTKILKKSDGLINWKKTAKEIERFVKAMTSWPGAFTNYLAPNGKIQSIKILKTKLVSLYNGNYSVGEIICEKNQLFIKCEQDALQILEIQLAGKKPISGEDFLKGYKNLIGTKLG